VTILGTGRGCAGFRGSCFVSHVYQLFALQCVLASAQVVDCFGFEEPFLSVFGVAFVGLCPVAFALEDAPGALAEAG